MQETWEVSEKKRLEIKIKQLDDALASATKESESIGHKTRGVDQVIAERNKVLAEWATHKTNYPELFRPTAA